MEEKNIKQMTTEELCRFGKQSMDFLGYIGIMDEGSQAMTQGEIIDCMREFIIRAGYAEILIEKNIVTEQIGK